MKNKEIALCDQDSLYITMFASFLMEHVSNAGIHIFTTPESLFADDADYDVAIMTEDFSEVVDFRKSGTIKKRYILVEEQSKGDNEILKYQSMESILSMVPELDAIRGKNIVSTKNKSKTKILGVYSPISHELQLPFSMALGQSMEEYGKVLFLDLEEISILPGLIGGYFEDNLTDLLYEICANENTKEITDYVHQFMGFDYISPFMRPDEITEIDEGTWKLLFERLQGLGYDTIVVLFGRAISGFSSILQMVNKLYVLGKPGDYFKKGQQQFLDYVDGLEYEVDVQSVLLPLSASNLTEGTYCIEELLHGKLGLFVRRELVVA